MSVLRKWLLTLWVGGPYKPLTQRGRRAAGAKKFALVLTEGDLSGFLQSGRSVLAESQRFQAIGIGSLTIEY